MGLGRSTLFGVGCSIGAETDDFLGAYGGLLQPATAKFAHRQPATRNQRVVW